MEQLRKPFWLLVSFVWPMILLILLFNETYQIIESLLSADQKNLWAVFGTYYSYLIVICTIYISYLIIRKKVVGHLIAWIVLLINILNITLFFFFIDEVLPRSIPEWMFTSSDLTIYPYSFLIPGALYSLIILVIKYTPEPRWKNAYVNLVPIVAIPIVVLSASMGFSIFDSYESSVFVWFKYVPIFMMVFLTCIFLFFLIRFVFILSIKSEKKKTLEIVIKILFTCLFPVAGLFFNNIIDSHRGGIFGNFQHPLFFVFSIINGVALCLPDSDNNKLRWLSFIVRSILLVFILYFFTIFLPFLPLSILAILAIGFGFLMLAPIIVLVYQLNALRNDINYLKTISNKFLVYGVFTVSVLVLPLVITINYQLDRSELDRIFTFLYDRSFDDEKTYSFNPKRVDRMMNHIHDVKSTGINHTPFLDSYYNWIVLDNLMLSDNKIDEISSVIKGGKLESKHPLFSWFSFPSHNAYLDNYKVESKYNGKQWTSFLHLDVATKDYANSEFRLYINTPNDCFISNYYLEINGEKEFGILAEKKSANWVYNNIVKTRRDPGIFNSIGHNKYLLKIFPVQRDQKRVTGIEFTHREPIEISLNDTVIKLGDYSKMNDQSYEILDGQGVFISSKAKIKLPKTVRKPEYHLIVDRSINNDMTINQIEKVVNKLKDSLPNSENINLWAVNYDIESLSKESWKNDIQKKKTDGGFYPEFLMKKVLVQSHKNHTKTSPVFIMITSDPTSISIVDGFTNLMFSIPDMRHYYSCNEKMIINQYDLESGQQLKKELFSKIKPDSTYLFNWKKTQFYLCNDSDSEYICDSISFVAKTKWQEGVLMDNMMRNYALNPSLKSEWHNIVKSSMKSGILVPYTSYISLENEAQKKALLKKQKAVLASNKNFDLEEAEPMSEPNVIWYMIVILIGYFGYSRKKRTI